MEWLIFFVGFTALFWIIFKVCYTLNRIRQVFKSTDGVFKPYFMLLVDRIFWVRLLGLAVDGVLTVGVMGLSRLTVPGRVGAAVGGSVALTLSVMVFFYERMAIDQ